MGYTMQINRNTTFIGDKLLKKIISTSTTLKKVKNSGDLIKVLNSHNLIPVDDLQAEEVIKNKGYYYVTGYRRVFIDSFQIDGWKGKFEPSTTIENIYSLMEFDKKISNLIFDYLNNNERKMKVRSAYFLAMQFGEDFYFDQNYFKDHTWHDSFLNVDYKQVLNSGLITSNPVICHHIFEYSGRLPIWVLFEHISFGSYIKVINGLKNNFKNAVFNDIFVSSQNAYDISLYMSPAIYIHMLDVLRFCRNRIAHLGRIYDWQSNYKVMMKQVNPEYHKHFDSTKNYYNLADIIHIMGMFLNVSDHRRMLNKINEYLMEMKSQIPNPYFTRIVSLTGLNQVA